MATGTARGKHRRSVRQGKVIPGEVVNNFCFSKECGGDRSGNKQEWHLMSYVNKLKFMDSL